MYGGHGFGAYHSTAVDTESASVGVQFPDPLDVAVASAGHRVEEEEDQGLPEGWIVQFDPTSGANYYTNISTGETSWTPPAS
jgi:hypothetical protein